MKILLTNDDGIESLGLKALEERLKADHEIWVVAPDTERSGTSHGITLKDAVKMKAAGENRYSLDGTPADCVLYSFLGAIPAKPDIVVSGINLGPNLGTDIIYSGTVAAAREAALKSIPGIAVSLDAKGPPYHFELAAEFIARNLELLAGLWHPDHFININVPNTGDLSTGYCITHPSRRLYKDGLERFESPGGDIYLFLKGAMPHAEPEENSDWEAVTGGRISVSPVYLHPINHEYDEAYHEVRLRRAR